MTGPQSVGCISSIFQNMKQLQDLEFPAYGSLYISTRKPLWYRRRSSTSIVGFVSHNAAVSDIGTATVPAVRPFIAVHVSFQAHCFEGLSG